MKALSYTALIVAAISLIIGIASRIMVQPIGPMVIEAQAFLQFTNTCLLAAIAFAVLQLFQSKT